MSWTKSVVNFSECTFCCPSSCFCCHCAVFSSVQFLATIWTVARQLLCPWDVFRQGYWSGLPFSSSRGSSPPRDRTLVSCVSCLADSSPAEPSGKPLPHAHPWYSAINSVNSLFPLPLIASGAPCLLYQVSWMVWNYLGWIKEDHRLQCEGLTTFEPLCHFCLYTNN